MPGIQTDERKSSDVPIYWFCKLERAVEEGDFAAAAEAQRELARLGVHVRYGRPREGKAVARVG